MLEKTINYINQRHLAIAVFVNCYLIHAMLHSGSAGAIRRQHNNLTKNLKQRITAVVNKAARIEDKLGKKMAKAFALLANNIGLKLLG